MLLRLGVAKSFLLQSDNRTDLCQIKCCKWFEIHKQQKILNQVFIPFPDGLVFESKDIFVYLNKQSE